MPKVPLKPNDQYITPRQVMPEDYLPEMYINPVDRAPAFDEIPQYLRRPDQYRGEVELGPTQIVTNPPTTPLPKGQGPLFVNPGQVESMGGEIIGKSKTGADSSGTKKEIIPNTNAMQESDYGRMYAPIPQQSGAMSEEIPTEKDIDKVRGKGKTEPGKSKIKGSGGGKSTRAIPQNKNLVQNPYAMGVPSTTERWGLSDMPALKSQQEVNQEFFTEPEKKAMEEQGKIYDKLKTDLENTFDENAKRIRELRDGKIEEGRKIQQGANDLFKQKMKDLDNEYSRLGDMRIENDRLFNNMGTGRRILVGVGLFLSAFDRPAMVNSLNVIDRAIQRDIDAQKNAMENQRYKVAGKVNMFKLMMDKYNSDIEAEKALALLQRRKVLDTLDIMAKKQGIQENVLKIKKLQAEIQAKMMPDIKFLREAAQRQMVAADIYRNADPVMQIIQQAHAKKPDDKMRELQMKDLNDYRIEQGALKQVDEVFEDLRDANYVGSKIWFIEDNAQFAGAFAQLFGPFKSLIGEAVTTGELRVLKPLIPKPRDRDDIVNEKKRLFKRALINKFPKKTYLNALMPANRKFNHVMIQEKEPNL